ncbi:hypothetical protein FF1_034205 [Malus domestica]
MEVVRLAEMKQYCVNDANLSDALPPNQRKSLIAQILNFLEVTSWDANNHNNSGKHCDGENSAACFHFNTLYTGDISLSEYANIFKTTSQKSPSNVPILVESLFEKGYDIVSGGTENHLVWVNLRDIGIDGSEAEKVLESVHIAAIKNNVPGCVFAVVLVGVLSIESPFSFETIIGVEGLEIDKGYFFPQFATNPEKLFVEFENAGVLIIDQKISRMFKVGEDCQSTGILVMVGGEAERRMRRPNCWGMGPVKELSWRSMTLRAIGDEGGDGAAEGEVGAGELVDAAIVAGGARFSFSPPRRHHRRRQFR